ncbi:MAG: hypothetical protein AAGI30_09435 [Planctomycetota bacterium]
MDVIRELSITDLKPQRVADVLEVDLNLARKLVAVVDDPDRFAGVRELPGRGGMRIILDSARKKGVSDSAIGRVESSLEMHQQLTRVHAGDRAVLDSMLGHLAEHGSTRADLAVRRNAFRANASTFGVQARLQILNTILLPGNETGGFPLLSAVRGFADFQRLSRGRTWIVGRSRIGSNDDLLKIGVERYPMDPDVAPDDVPLLRSHCSPNLPALKRRTIPDGHVVDELVDGEIGKRGVCTFFTGEFMRTMGSVRRPHGYVARFSPRCYTPCELLVFDVLVHPDLPMVEPPQYYITSDIDGSNTSILRSTEMMRLPVCEAPEQRIGGRDGLLLAELPTYHEMILDVASRMDVDISDFVLWRLKLRYPPIPSEAIMEWGFSTKSPST